MPVKRFAILAFFAAAATAAVAANDHAVIRGSNPVFSPGGTHIAFQSLEGDVFKIGVIPVAGGEVEWIESGPGNAAYPAWTPDGALIYMAGNDTETAYEAWKSGSQSGYGLRLWRDGVKRDLTRGRCRDYTPCVSPDGRTVYFVTTRGVESESASFSKAAATRIASIDLSALANSPTLNSPTLNSPSLNSPTHQLLFLASSSIPRTDTIPATSSLPHRPTARFSSGATLTASSTPGASAE